MYQATHPQIAHQQHWPVMPHQLHAPITPLQKRGFFGVNTAVWSNSEQIIYENLFILAPPSQVKPIIFFSKLKLVIMSMIDPEGLFDYLPFVVGMPRWWFLFFRFAK